MAKKQKMTMERKLLSYVKTGAKAATHTMTFAGVLVATSPVHRGFQNLSATGDVAGSGRLIVEDSIGPKGTTLMNSAKTAATNVAIPAIVGIGLIAAGALIRRRIGR